MAQLGGSHDVSDEPEHKMHPNACLDEDDQLPLKLRLKTLLSSKRLPAATDGNLSFPENGREGGSTSRMGIDGENEEARGYWQDVFSIPLSCFVSERSNSESSQEHEKLVNNVAADPCFQSASSNQSSSSNFPQHSRSPSIRAAVKVENGENNPKSSSGGGIVGSSGSDIHDVKNKNEILNDFADEPDCISLRERQRMLLSRKPLGMLKPVLQGNSEQLSNQPMECHAVTKSRETHFVNGSSPVAGHPSPSITNGSASGPFTIMRSGALDGIISGSSSVAPQWSPLVDFVQGAESTKARTWQGVKGSFPSFEKISTKVNPCEVQGSTPALSINTPDSAASISAIAKDEPLDNNYSDSLDKNAAGCSSTGFISSKSELQTPDESLEDPLDHMPLLDRIELMMSGNVSDMNTFKNFGGSKANVPPGHESRPPVSEPVKPTSSKRTLKRKKTATISAEMALEEDAPGLLRALLDKGISMDEIKLFGDMENDDMLGGSFIEGNFSELQAVMSKIFSPRQSGLKLAPIRCAKVAKTSYCLPCLVSLIEQSRYLQFRKWPVEWGWCRDLRSFLFVFERHNRIVLERPEYGYATYFFEIADSVPIDWQTKRLVTIMRLTNCARLALIENKALLVGEDLSEDEANVMMEYGWTANDGLATMLNYRDRVFHDKKKEDGTEWKSKIMKLLMDGYNGGTLVSTIIPNKVIEYIAEHGAQIKQEL